MLFRCCKSGFEFVSEFNRFLCVFRPQQTNQSCSVFDCFIVSCFRRHIDPGIGLHVIQWNAFSLYEQQGVSMLRLKVTLYSSLFEPVRGFRIAFINSSTVNIKLTDFDHRMEVAKFGSSKEISDDDLLSDPTYTRDLCEALKPLKRKWMSQMSATYVAHHHELLKTLGESGCSAMFMGLESINQSSLKSVDKQNTVKTYEELIRRIHDQGIDIHAGFVCGLDHEDVYDFERTAEWATRMGLCGAIWRIQIPYPGTRLYEELKAAGRLLTTDWTYYSGEHVVYRPAKMTVEELYWGHKWVKGHFNSYRSIGERMVRRTIQNGAHELLNTLGSGLGYRSMFHLAADTAAVNVYRDLRHLPPQEEPVAYRFPYPPPKRFGFVSSRLQNLGAKVRGPRLPSQPVQE